MSNSTVENRVYASESNLPGQGTVVTEVYNLKDGQYSIEVGTSGAKLLKGIGSEATELCRLDGAAYKDVNEGVSLMRKFLSNKSPNEVIGQMLTSLYTIKRKSWKFVNSEHHNEYLFVKTGDKVTKYALSRDSEQQPVLGSKSESSLEEFQEQGEFDYNGGKVTLSDVDSGHINFIELSEGAFVAHFDGKELSGYYSAKKNDTFFALQKVAVKEAFYLSVEKPSIITHFADFKLSRSSDGSLTIKGVAIRGDGYYNGVYFPWEEVKAMARSLVGSKITYAHRNVALGKVVATWIDEATKNIYFEGRVTDPLMIDMIVNENRFNAVSTEGEYALYRDVINNSIVAKQIHASGLSIVEDPACPSARFFVA